MIVDYSNRKGVIPIEQTKTFFTALETWKEETGAKVNDYASLLFAISYALGGDDKGRVLLEESELYNQIHERVIELITVQNMQEDFVISSLVKLVDEHLEHNISNLGSAISLNLEASKNEKLKKVAEKTLSRLTAPNYTYYAIVELESWRKISIEKLGESRRRDWNFDRISQNRR